MTVKKMYALFLCLVFMTKAFSMPAFKAFGEAENILLNGSFAKGSSGWGLYLESGGFANFKAESGKGVLTVSKAGSKDYSVQLYYDGFGLKQGGTYRFAFTVTSSAKRTVRARIQLNGGDYSAYFEKDVSLESGIPARIEQDFEMTKESDPAPRLCLTAASREMTTAAIP
jgi:endoglucanase